MEITLDQKWILNWIRREVNPKTCNLYIYIYIWDYGGHQLRLKAPRCTTTAPQVRLHGPWGVSSLD